MSYLLVFGAALLRLVPHIPNFAPVAAVGLFSGTYLNKKVAVFVPVAAMLLSDIFVGFYHIGVMAFVYLAFTVSALVGLWLRKRQSFANTVGATLFISIQFFVLTNFAVWAFGTMYPHTLEGLLASYINALPFFRNSLAGNFVYVGVLFGSMEAVRYYKSRRAFAEKPIV